MKDEGSIGKKMREAMLAKGKPIVLEKVRLYVQIMTKVYFKAKRVELRVINQLHLRQPWRLLLWRQRK